MLSVINKTPYAAMIAPGTDERGADFVTVVVKGTFALEDGSVPRVADEQVPILGADEFHGEPGVSSVKYEADTGPRKPGTDVVLVGHAYASSPRSTQLDVELVAGPVAKTVRVFGDRRLRRLAGLRRIPSPEPFERISLVYENAFGGADVSHKKEKKHAYEPRNPVGRGFTTAGKGDHFDDFLLPNLEDPRQLIKSPKSKPAPACFGFVARSWEPRRSFAGTYDEAWERDRCPLLPEDFDPRYFRAAHPDLAAPAPFRGGERVRVTNVTPGGELVFELPRVDIDVRARLQMREDDHGATLDTLLIEPDEGRIVLTWKATIPCPRKLLHLSWVRIREARS